MMRVNSQVKINTARVQQLTQAAVTSLEQTADDWLPGGKEEAFARDTFKNLYRRNAGL